MYELIPIAKLMCYSFNTWHITKKWYEIFNVHCTCTRTRIALYAWLIVSYPCQSRTWFSQTTIKWKIWRTCYSISHQCVVERINCKNSSDRRSCSNLSARMDSSEDERGKTITRQDDRWTRSKSKIERLFGNESQGMDSTTERTSGDNE